MRFPSPAGLFAILLASLAVQFASAQNLPASRRLLILTQAFLDSATVKEPPAPLVKEKSHVLVLFRVAESGRVMDSRAIGGSEKARNNALSSVKAWQFKPTPLNGRPIQMQSGAQFDFSVTPVTVVAPQPMSAAQISPVLSTRCSLALLKNDPNSVPICKQETLTVDSNSAHTAMESLSAHDEFGLALMQVDHDARQALTEFSRAVELAPDGLNQSDGEWAELYWHRAAAEQQLGKSEEAYRDFVIAEQTFARAAVVGEGTSAYNNLMGQLIRQHASLLKSDGKQEEADALLKTLPQ